jgi:TolB-like protein
MALFKEGIMLKKLCIIAVLFVCFGSVAFAQVSKPRLGILPFTGGTGGDGETVATLFSFQPEILEAFTVVPRTSAVNALVAEQNFQLSGYTDSDTISRLGRMLNADFVVSGFIRNLGDRKLVITTIVNVETFEQLAGDYREYRTVEEIPSLMPVIANIIINASQINTSELPKLAIVPFNLANTNVNVQDAEALAQILSIEVGKAGKYVVLPRTTAIQSAMKELEYQMSGATAEEEAKALGRAINAEFVLNAEVRSLGSTNMFTASILHVEDGSLLVGGYRNYQAIGDGIVLMAELAKQLTAGAAAAYPSGQTAKPAKPEKKPKEYTPEADRAARLNTVGVSVGSSFAAPLVIGTVSGTFAPVRHLFVELGCDLGFIYTGEKGADYTLDSYYSLYPFVHISYFKPSAKKGGWHLGAGGGYMFSEYTFSDGTARIQTFALDMATGVNIGNVFDISYTLRTNFSGVSNKVSAGVVYRFK